MVIQRVSKPNESNGYYQYTGNNLILKAMRKEFGHFATHSILSYVSRVTMKSKSEILSDYDTFSKLLKQVYTEEVAEKEILDRLSSFGLREKIV